jgi:hypothetical protein
MSPVMSRLRLRRAAQSDHSWQGVYRNCRAGLSLADGIVAAMTSAPAIDATAAPISAVR